MKQNAYDDDTFFEGYKNLRESGSGLNDVLEQPSIRSLLPGLSGLDVLDLVVSSFVMHYVADYGALVQNVFRWLRPGGKFVYSCEHPIVTAKLPGCGHWVKDEEGRKLYWCIDNYGDEGTRQQTWFIKAL